MEKDQWSFVISDRVSWFDFHLKELWEYRNLITMFVKRNFATMYKQTILGPAWIVISPLLSTAMFTIVFGKIANLPTEGVPEFIFYMAANILWMFFSSSMQKVSFTFTGNAHIFGKVYFPRLSVPISNILTNLCNFLIQFAIFSGFLVYLVARGNDIHPNSYMLLTPFLLLELGLLALGLGILISALTAKYHDLSVLVSFGLQLWMYGSPVVYPVSMVPERFAGIFMLNPVAPVIETFRYAFLGSGSIPWMYLGISVLETLVLLLVGMIAFNKVERTFLDTV